MHLHRAIPLLCLLLVTCALRENPYDPLSPYHKAPNLSINLAYDSLKVFEIQGDSIHAEAPFNLSLSLSAQEFLSPFDTLPVTIYHHYGTDIHSYINVRDTTIRLIESGYHSLNFTTKAANGAVSERDIVLFIDTREQPTFLSFAYSKDSLPMVPILDSRGFNYFTVAIKNPSLLSLIIFNYGNFDTKMKSDFESTGDTLYLEFPYSFSPPMLFPRDTAIQITATLYDSLNRSDTISTSVIFSWDKFSGSAPPHIDSIYIENRPDTIFEEEEICFNVSAYDLPENPVTPVGLPKHASEPAKDSGFLTYFWDFGDGVYSANKSLCKKYYDPGNYTIIVTVTDNSMNPTKDSIAISVMKKTGLPVFKNFLVTYESTVAPCTLYVSANAISTASKISSYNITFNNTESFNFDLPLIVDWEHILNTPDIYNINVTAIDEDGNTCDTSFTVTVTAPL